MGLDGVELVMEVEDRFGVTLLDSECQQVRTVADLAALVISRLPSASIACPSARAFYQVRRLLVDHAHMERSRVRPDTRWEELFPHDLPRMWNGLRALEHRLPPLAFAPGVEVAIGYAGLVGVFATLGGAAVAWHQLGLMAGALTLGLGLALLATARGFLHPLRTRVPVGLGRLGDLARHWGGCRLTLSGELGPGGRLIQQQRVLDEVRAITSEQLGVPLERVKAESDFVRDLGLD